MIVAAEFDTASPQVFGRGKRARSTTHTRAPASAAAMPAAEPAGPAPITSTSLDPFMAREHRSAPKTAEPPGRTPTRIRERWASLDGALPGRDVDAVVRPRTN